MGNKQISEKKNQVIEIDLSHPKFVNSKLVKVDNEVHVQTKIGCDQKQFDKWYKSISLITPEKQHLFLPVVSKFQSNNFCGSNGNAVLNFPYFPYLLSEQIYNRLGKKTKFQQNDLWYLLFSLASARHEIQKFGLSTLGDIRTSNIFLNDQGKVRVGNLLSWPNEMKPFEKAIQKQYVYLSPEQFQHLVRGQNQDLLNTTAQVFSIGITLLNAGLLVDDGSTASLYDHKNSRFNREQYERRVQEWIFGRGYSQILKSTILNLISWGPQNRITAGQLWQFISPYQKSIQSRQNFAIINAPLKIHNQVGRLKQIKAKSNSISNQYLQRSVVIKHQTSNYRSPERLVNQYQHQQQSKNNIRIQPVDHSKLNLVEQSSSPKNQSIKNKYFHSPQKDKSQKNNQSQKRDL